MADKNIKYTKELLDRIQYPNVGRRLMYNESLELVPDTTLEQNVNLSEYKEKKVIDPLSFYWTSFNPRVGETVMVRKPTVKQVLMSPIYKTKDDVKSVIDYIKIFGRKNPLAIPTIEEIEINKSK